MDLESSPPWKTPAQFGVLVTIGDLTNDKRGGFAWPSKAAIARRVRVSPRYVPKVVRELEDLGLLEVTPGAGPRNTHRYRLTLTSAVEFIPRGSATSAVEFIPSDVESGQGMNSNASGDELDDRGDEPDSTGGVLPGSSDPISPLRDPVREPITGPRTEAAPPARSLLQDESKRITSIAKTILKQGPVESHEELVTAILEKLEFQETEGKLVADRVQGFTVMLWVGYENRYGDYGSNEYPRRRPAKVSA